MTGWGFQLIDDSQITLSPSDNYGMSTQYRIDQVLAHRQLVDPRETRYTND
jgi:hypothetical protein